MAYNPQNPNGQATSLNSSPVVLSSEQEAKIDLLATKAKQDILLTELQLKADLTETQPVSIASIPSHPVTNAGTFGVQVTSNPAEGIISTANSSIVALAANGVFTGTSEDITNYSSITVAVMSNVVSATDGLQMQQSIDGTNWDLLDVFTIAAAAGKTLAVHASAKFFRVMYTNGATVQASFRMQTIYHRYQQTSSSVRPQDARANENDFSESLSYSMGYNGVAWDRLRSTIANGLQVDVTRMPSPSITYSAVANGIVPATAATDLVTIYGSATKTINILNVWVTGVQTTAGQAQILLIKRSTANTAGTSTAQTRIPYDSNDVAATATVLAYTANPTLGTAIGNVRGDRAFLPGAAAAVDAQGLAWSFMNGKSMILRGVAQGIAINLNGATLAGGSINVTIEWTEV